MYKGQNSTNSSWKLFAEILIMAMLNFLATSVHRSNLKSFKLLLEGLCRLFWTIQSKTPSTAHIWTVTQVTLRREKINEHHIIPESLKIIDTIFKIIKPFLEILIRSSITKIGKPRNDYILILGLWYSKTQIIGFLKTLNKCVNHSHALRYKWCKDAIRNDIREHAAQWDSNAEP